MSELVWRLGEMIVGQPRAISFLERWAGSETQPPLLFTGPPGIGKRTAALLCAQALNCTDESTRPCGVCRQCSTIGQLSHPDVRLLFPIRLQKTDPRLEDAAEATMDRYCEYTLAQPQPEPDHKHRVPLVSVHWLRREMAKPPVRAHRRIFIILHAHQMYKEAPNALLKMLEEPQKQTTFILTTDNPGLLLDTIRSRCQTIRFTPLPRGLATSWVAEHADVDDDEAELAATVAGGSLGGALRFLEDRETSLLEPVVDYFAGRSGTDERAVTETLGRLKEATPTAVVSTLLFLHHEALNAVLGRGSSFAKSRPADMRLALTRDAGYLRRAIRLLLERSRECGTNVNARLFNFTLLTMLRPPAA